MMEFIKNIWYWILENRENITTVFSSSTFVGLATLFVTNLKHSKKLSDNTSTVATAMQTISTNNGMAVNVNKLLELAESLTSTLNNLNEKVSEYSSITADKINAILEIQSIVYSTIKDDTIRNSVNALLIRAKHSEDCTKAELQKELDELKDKFSKLLNDINVNAAEIVNNTVVNDATVNNDNPVRG